MHRSNLSTCIPEGQHNLPTSNRNIARGVSRCVDLMEQEPERDAEAIQPDLATGGLTDCCVAWV